jgi:hypothetical protein
VGQAVSSLVPSPLIGPRLVGDEIFGQISAVDHFGNLMTNVHGSMVAAALGLRLSFPDRGIPEIDGLFETYGEAKVGALMVLTGSSGYIEVAVNQGSASNQLGVGAGDAVKIDLI